MQSPGSAARAGAACQTDDGGDRHRGRQRLDLVEAVGTAEGDVHVGQEVVFDGNSVKVPGAKLMANGMIQGRYEWDFGDTYTQKWADHFPTSQQGGSPTTHFFMRPGTFHVTLTVTDTNTPPDTNTASVDVNVAGDWPKLPPLPAAPETLWLKFADGSSP